MWGGLRYTLVCNESLVEAGGINSSGLTHITDRPTAIIQMVAAARSQLEREASLHQFPAFDLTEYRFKVELMTNDLADVIQSADGLHQISRINNLDRQLFSFLTGTAYKPFEGHTVKHKVVIMNLAVRTVLRGEIAGLTLNANNLIQHFTSLFLLVLSLCQLSFFVLFGQVQGLSTFALIIKL